MSGWSVPSLFQLICVRREGVSESRFQRETWRLRQADLASFSLGCCHTLQPLTSNVIFCTFLLRLDLVPNLFPLLPTCRMHPRSTSRQKRPCTFNRNMYTRTTECQIAVMRLGWCVVEVYPKQRRVCSVRKSCTQDRVPIDQLDIEVQRSCPDESMTSPVL